MFGNVWEAQGVGNVELFLYNFQQRISDISCQEWSTSVANSPKLITYKSFKSTLNLEKYLVSVKHRRHHIALSRFRCSVHKLAVEKFRSVKERDERLCIYCLNKG